MSKKIVELKNRINDSYKQYGDRNFVSLQIHSSHENVCF